MFGLGTNATVPGSPTVPGTIGNRLAAALLENDPSCRNDDRFTLDSPSAEDLRACRAICEKCPLFTPCREFARATRPEVGIWAGRQYGRKAKNEEGND